MRQEPNIMSFREEVKQVFTRDLHSGLRILIYSVIRDGEEDMRLTVKILFLPEGWVYEFVKGMQGDDPKYLKTVATAKHYAVHSGPESLRHSFNAKVSEIDLRETYLPAFRTLVMDAGVYSVMGAYNMFRDYPCCANPILYGILKK